MQIPPTSKIYTASLPFALNSEKITIGQIMGKLTNQTRQTPAVIASFGEQASSGSGIYSPSDLLPPVGDDMQLHGFTADGEEDTDYSYENMREFIENYVVNLSQPDLDSYGNYELLSKRLKAETIKLTAEDIEGIKAERAARTEQMKNSEYSVTPIPYERGSITHGLYNAIDHMLGEIYEAYMNTEEYKLADESQKGKTIIFGNLSWLWEKYEGRELSDWLLALTQSGENGRSALQEIGDKLTKAANATENMPNATAEERAMQREAVVRMASEIAKDFGLSAEATGIFMKSVYAQVGMDSVRDTGEAIQLPDGRVFYRSQQYSNKDYLRDAIKPEHRELLEKSFREAIGLNEAKILSQSLGYANYYDRDDMYGFFAWIYQRSDYATSENARKSFDSAISEQKYASVNQWQSEMRDFMKQFLE